MTSYLDLARDALAKYRSRASLSQIRVGARTTGMEPGSVGHDGDQQRADEDGFASEDWIETRRDDGRIEWVRRDFACREAVVIDIPDPCLQCGGIVFWWDLRDGQHCEKCDPPIRGRAFRKRARQLRRHYARTERKKHHQPRVDESIAKDILNDD